MYIVTSCQLHCCHSTKLSSAWITTRESASPWCIKTRYTSFFHNGYQNYRNTQEFHLCCGPFAELLWSARSYSQGSCSRGTSKSLSSITLMEWQGHHLEPTADQCASHLAATFRVFQNVPLFSNSFSNKQPQATSSDPSQQAKTPSFRGATVWQSTFSAESEPALSLSK